MLTLHRACIETPLGPMVALASRSSLCALEFHREERVTGLDARLARWFSPCTVVERANSVIEETENWLRNYFSGVDARIDGLPLDMRGAPFELRVWAALKQIPAGETRSYGEIAKRIGDAGAWRAVGMANGANPIAIIVPCHRVIGANGSLTGYGGGLDKKTWLLDHERRWRTGVLF